MKPAQSSPRSVLALAASLALPCALVACSGSAAEDDRVLLHSELDADGDKADSIGGRELRWRLTELVKVRQGRDSLGGAGCQRTGVGPWFCSDGEGRAVTNVAERTDHSLRMDGALVTSTEAARVHRFGVSLETFGLFWNALPRRVGQLLFVRGVVAGRRSALEGWRPLVCPGVSYWPGEVVVDLDDFSVTTGTSRYRRRLESCGLDRGRGSRWRPSPFPPAIGSTSRASTPSRSCSPIAENGDR